MNDSSLFTGNVYKVMKDSFGINREVDEVELDLTEFEEEVKNEENN